MRATLEVADAVELCKSAGITVVMITGDNLSTAYAIASKLGICSDAKQTVTHVRNVFCYVGARYTHAYP